jgi:hypothetical protein
LPKNTFPELALLRQPTLSLEASNTTPDVDGFAEADWKLFAVSSPLNVVLDDMDYLTTRQFRVAAFGVTEAAVGLQYWKFTFPAVGHELTTSSAGFAAGAALKAHEMLSVVVTPVAATVTVVPQDPAAPVALAA